MRGFVAGMALALAPWVVSGCSTPSASDSVQGHLGLVVTQVGADSAWAPSQDPSKRYPIGSRIVYVRSNGAAEDVRLLSGALAAAGSPAISPRGDAAIFAGRADADGRWSIYKTSLERGRPRRLVEFSGDCIDPAYLTPQRIVLSCRTSSLEDWQLYTAAPDGSNLRRISFGIGAATGPAALTDGRIIFSQAERRATGPGSEERVALYTLNPDGTLLEPFSGSHDPGAARLQPREGDGVVFVVASRPSTGWSGLERIEMGRPQSGRVELEFPLRPLSVEASSDGELLVAAESRVPDQVGRRTAGIYRWIPGGGEPSPIFDTTDWAETEVRAVSTGLDRASRNLPSSIDPSRSVGTLVCYDANRSDGEVGPKRDSAVLTKIAIEGATRTGRSASAIELSRHAVESDGSFALEVPADTPVRLRSLDSDGAVIATSSWFWVRPGEVRACFGCHEDRESAPVNRPVEALAKYAQALSDAQGTSR